MASFVRRLQNILVSKWFAVVLISLLLSCLSIFPIANASAQTCSGAWDVTVSGLKLSYQPGENIDIVVSFKARNPADCPGCIQQILVGMVDQNGKAVDVYCVYNGQAMVCPNWTTGNKAISLKAPSVTGTYKFVAANEYQYNCQDAQKVFFRQPTGPLKEIASINIEAIPSPSLPGESPPTTSPIPPPTGKDTTTSSPGSSWIQNVVLPKVGDAIQFIIISVVIVLLVLLLIFSFMGSKVRKRVFRFILVLAVVSFLGYLFWKYGIPAITDWFRENLSTIIGVLLSLGALAIAGIAIWKNWNKIRPQIPGPPEPSQTPPKPVGPTSSTIKGMRFEQKCKIILENMELNCETTKVSGDGGIDLRCHSNKPVVGGTYIVQCKDWKSHVGEPEIRDLYGTVTSERANKGILITSSYFTKAAWSFAEGKNIELIDGDKLNKLAKRTK